ncbi:MAG: hypothetical protein WBE98_01000 [Gammaproteobacteria bacterium]
MGSSDRITKRRRRLVCAAVGALTMTGCASVGDSPRAPYGLSPALEDTRNEIPAGLPFRIADASSWRQAMAARGESGFGEPALERGRLGLFDAADFRVARGDCADCGVSELIRWWFADELVAVPAGTPAGGAAVRRPQGIWIGAPSRVFSARLAAGGRRLESGGRGIELAIVPPLPTNTAYLDDSTLRYFAARPLIVRGGVAPDREVFVARTLFPDDVRIDLDAAPRPLARRELLATLIEAQASGEAQRVLFARDGEWRGRPVVAFVLTGAQGDDDGARGGHLAVATGVVGERGEWHDWLVTNFYPLVEGNAKGIIPASLPIDNYLYDLNSGQLFYRPGYMLVAVLRNDRVAAAIQKALDETLLELYCGAIEFDRARLNSTAMTIDTLRDLGWRIPEVGPTSRIAGLAAAPIAGIVRRSLGTARAIYATFAAEKTRLLPRVAFEVAGHDLLELAEIGIGSDALDELTPFERMLAEDVVGIVFVRLPQVPSARPFGTYPAASLLTYGTALLADPRPYEGAPEAAPRAFSERLKAACPASS